MQHSFAVSFMSGGLGAGPGGMGVYTNQLQYLISDKMVINSTIHLAQPGMPGPGQFDSNNLRLYYQTALDWRPTKNIRLHLGLSNLPYSRYYPGMYRSPYNRIPGQDYSPTTGW